MKGWIASAALSLLTLLAGTTPSGAADSAPPKGSIRINGGAGWTNSARVVLTLSASDPSGVARMCLSNGRICGSWVRYAKTKSWGLTSANGTKQVSVWFKDRRGNTNRRPFKAAVVLDTGKPADGGSLSATPGSGVVSLGWSAATDGVSGIGGYVLVVSEVASPASCLEGTPIGTLDAAAGSYEHLGVTGGTTYHYRLCALDRAGNMSAGLTASALAQDGGPPSNLAADAVRVTSPLTAVSSSYTLEGTVAAEVASLSCRVGDGAPQPVAIVAGAFSAPLTLAPGANPVEITAADGSGGTGSFSVFVTYDTGQPSSEELIEGALAAGTITAEQALEYRVFSLFRDPRLPPQYAGDDSSSTASTTMYDLREAWETLSPEAQALLDPFLVPPCYEGSWHGLRELAGGRARSAADGVLPRAAGPVSPKWAAIPGTLVKVWYLTAHEATDRPKALAILALMETDEKVWSRLTRLMGRQPLSDINEEDNGGDGRFDIYLEDIANDGVTMSRIWWSRAAVPTFTLLNRKLGLPAMKAAMVHEFMHAIQFSITFGAGATLSGELLTLGESTACWAAHFIFGKTNTWEQQYLWGYLNNVEKGFETRQPPEFMYGIYVFPLYLSKIYGDGIIRELWDATQSNRQIEAIDAVLKAHGSNLQDEWPRYAVSLWNQGPVDDFRSLWSNIPANPATDKYAVLSLGGAPGGAVSLSPLLNRLSIRYSHFPTWSVSPVVTPDPSARSIAFLNGLTFRRSYDATVEGDVLTERPDVEIKGVKVQALVKRDDTWLASRDASGRWNAADWTKRGFVTFCQDDWGGDLLDAQDVEELVVITTYSNVSPGASWYFQSQDKAPVVRLSNALCGDQRANADFSTTTDGVTSRLTVTNLMYCPSVGGNGDHFDYVDGDPKRVVLYGKRFDFCWDYARLGSIRWSISGLDSEFCTYEGSFESNGIESTGRATLFTYPWAGGAANRTFDFGGFEGFLSGEQLTYEKTCYDEDGNPVVAQYSGSLSDFMFKPADPSDPLFKLKPDGFVGGTGAILEASANPDAQVNGSWSFSDLPH